MTYPIKRLATGMLALLAEAEAHSGVIVALAIPPEAGQELALDGGVPVSELHITLACLGDKETIPPQALARLRGVVSDFARQYAALTGKVSGVGRFSAEPVDPVYLSFDCPELPGFQQALVTALEDAGMPVKKDHGFTPHITTIYIPPDAPMPVDRVTGKEIRFDKVDVWMGGEHFAYPLVGMIADGRGRDGRKA
jgi:2'-5' RNA ligase